MTYLNVHQVAEQLGLSAQTIYRWRCEGRDMPLGFLVGSRVRWTQQCVDEWMSRQQEVASSK